jgi:hypothetical protein
MVFQENCGNNNDIGGNLRIPANYPYSSVDAVFSAGYNPASEIRS